MTLQNAAYALDELALGRQPDAQRVFLGVTALDPLLVQADRDLALIEAASTLDLYLAQGIAPYQSAARRNRASELAWQFDKPSTVAEFVVEGGAGEG